MISFVLRYLGQAVAYAVFAASMAYFSMYPVFTYFPEDQAQIKFSLSHGGKPKGDCRRLTGTEAGNLQANMRKPQVCPRERLPVMVELRLDGQVLYQETLPPGGMWRDGQSRVYQRLAVTAGHHKLNLGLRDSARTDGFDYVREVEVDLKPHQNLVIDFRPETGGFFFR
ncbi:conserved hypothetical protein [uncultured Gammaproteobacteria bacterium]